MSTVRRIPIRIRVTLAFAAVMALVLGAVGLFLYFRLEAQLDHSIDQGLRSRAEDVSALVRASGPGLRGTNRGALIETDESFAQVLTANGRVIDSTRQLRGERALPGADLGQVLSAPVFVERSQLPGVDGRARLLATPVDFGGRQDVVVVGSSLADRDEALNSLLTLLLIGGSVALVLASLAGYGATAAALRPVERMRRRAAAVSAEDPGARLPVPPADDELSRLGATLNEMLARLETAIERERRFVDDASHELRTPLAMHKAELEMALLYASSQQELRAAIASATEEVDRLVQLAEDLLVVARSEQGELAVTLEPLPVADLFGVLEERFRARTSHAGRSLVVDPGAELAVNGDRLRLEQAMTNMVDNALRHGDGEIRVWARPSNGAVQLHVSDAGEGFQPEFIPHAFERFSRGDAARAGGGSGLGLAIVETIASAHHGRVGAGNDAGAGADVWIEVPSAFRPE